MSRDQQLDSGLAIPGRLELPTYGLGNRRSVQLSYGTVLILLTNCLGGRNLPRFASRSAGHLLAESRSTIQAHVLFEPGTGRPTIPSCP
jgi:hypothetical protein